MEKRMTHKKLYFVQSLTNVHCGTGQGVGDVDLPTAREAATGFPLVPGSTVKGVLRDHFTNCGKRPKTDLAAAFGPDFSDADSDADLYAAALMITDARMLLLPVRTFTGVFAYVTAPLVLHRFAADLRQAGIDLPGAVPQVLPGKALVSADTNLVNGVLLLEDLDLDAAAGEPGWKKWCGFLTDTAFAAEWGTDVVSSRLALVPDDLFSFLCRTTLPVTARIKLNKETGTVQEGALWYEESVPAEALLSGVIAAADSYTKKRFAAGDILADFASDPLTLQLGGKATTGKGICEVRFSGKGGQ